MPKEYIERGELLKKSETMHDGQRCCLAIREGYVYTAPAADVVEVVHASWEWGHMCGQYGIWCTNCGGGWVNSENAEWIAKEHDYCGKCGAKMDGERKEV